MHPSPGAVRRAGSSPSAWVSIPIRGSLRSIPSSSGSHPLARLARRAPIIERGFFYRRQAALIAAYNKRVAPIRQFVRFGSAPMLKTGKGIVSILPVDYLIWSPPLSSSSRAQAATGVARHRDLDHWPGKRDGYNEARRAWLEGGAQSRSSARAVIEHRPSDEGPNGVNLILTRQFRARRSQNSHSSTTATASHCKFGNVCFVP